VISAVKITSAAAASIENASKIAVTANRHITSPEPPPRFASSTTSVISRVGESTDLTKPATMALPQPREIPEQALPAQHSYPALPCVQPAAPDR
jgi:hypothetical protein